MTPSTPMPNTTPASRLSQTDSIPASIERITGVISDVCSVVPPVWPLKVVTSWINLQYYGSAVDNRAFGSGNKLIHNVTSQLGVLLGNGGDLMTGLPWQSVSDGVRLQHDPLRLLVLIEAPRAAVQTMIEKHAGVRDLVTNGWLSLVVREGDTFHRWTADQTWQADL